MHKDERCSYGSSGARSEKPHEEDLHPFPHGKAPPWAPGLHPGTPPHPHPHPTPSCPTQQMKMAATDKTNWVGSKEVKRGETRDQEKLSLLAQPGSGLMTLQLRHQI